MSDNRHDVFYSKLGDVAVTDSHVERIRESEDGWEIIDRNFPKNKLVDEIHFSNIKQLSYTEGSTYPYIEFETYQDNKLKMFFSTVDSYKDVFKCIKEKLAVYRQAYE